MYCAIIIIIIIIIIIMERTISIIGLRAYGVFHNV